MPTEQTREYWKQRAVDAERKLEIALEYAEAMRVAAAEFGKRTVMYEIDQRRSLPTNTLKARERRKLLEFYRYLTTPREESQTVNYTDGGMADGKPWSGVVALPMTPDEALKVIAQRSGANSVNAARTKLFREREKLPADHPLRSIRLPAGWDE